MSKTCTQYDIDRIVNTDHFDPYQLLGMHEIEVDGAKSVCVRAFLPDAREAFVFEVPDAKNGGKPVSKDNRYKMNKVDDRGFFEVIIKRTEVFKYNIEKFFYDNNSTTFYDSYAFPPILTDYDLHLFKEGNHHRIYDKLGAHYHEFEGIGGICFAVWAPNDKRVSVIGDFNMWDGRRHVMRVRQGVGVWEIFVPGLPMGSSYKFEIKSKQGSLIEKADPYAFASEVRPKTSSIVYDYNKYEWNDAEWIENRKKGNLAEGPMSVYEVHLGSWMRVPEDNNRFLTYRELAVRLTDYRTASSGRAPLRRFMGLSGHGLFRPHQSFRNAERLHVLRRLSSPERHRHNRRLGAGPLSERLARLHALRRHLPLRA